MDTRLQGGVFEYIACKYLQRKGYKLIQKNFYTKVGEIDLIFKDKDLTIFVEVKGLTKSFNNLLETVSKRKKKRLLATIYKWLLVNNKQDTFWRIDFLGIILKENKYIVTHIQNIDMNSI
ncbi:YraN family protein [Candidatus Dojkabacteria bacterium]|uniref:UPF0102 protein KC678_05415 n=1 Tax=Candidatus Dojkabacteria bacterium TaxID=2099670 RepID=A0A955L2H3_9BACT|nr:YraN family protein [Candidatus Dojkabacteria bacterium]